jgi:NitT/TauT family transport system substrate-binding protein
VLCVVYLSQLALISGAIMSGNQTHISRRSAVRTLAATVLAPAFASRASAEANVVRLATQPSLSYTPLFVMKELKLVEKHAATLGLAGMTTTWATFSTGGVMNDALLADQIDIAAGGTSGGLILWERTRGKGPNEVKGVATINSASFDLFSTRPEVKSIKDFTDSDRIAVPGVKSSIQAVLLQMAAAKEFGIKSFDKLDRLTVAMAHPDAYALLASGKSELTGHFSGPPYQYDQRKDKRLNKVLASSEITGGPMTMNMLWSSTRFHDSNPGAYKAVLKAFDEALAMTVADPKKTGEMYMANVKSKVTIDDVIVGLTDPDTKFSMTPQRTLPLAHFLNETGVLKTQMDSWKDFFFADIHELTGS